MRPAVVLLLLCGKCTWPFFFLQMTSRAGGLLARASACTVGWLFAGCIESRDPACTDDDARASASFLFASFLFASSLFLSWLCCPRS